jgi:heme/copper-type cytochrome/quinol oxidase subunit 2
MSKDRTLALAGMAFLLLNYPLLSVANHHGWTGSWPISFTYLFSIWLFLIGIAFLTAFKKRAKKNRHE